jgi:hypothetical protein
LRRTPGDGPEKGALAKVERTFEREPLAFNGVDVVATQSNADCGRIGNGNPRVCITRESEMAFVMVDWNTLPTPMKVPWVGLPIPEAATHARCAVGESEQGFITRGRCHFARSIA